MDNPQTRKTKNKRRILLIALAAGALILFALILRAYFFQEPKGGTPIIIKGFDDGSGGELMTIQGLEQNSPVGKGDVSTIKVSADKNTPNEKWWLYENPNWGCPIIKLVTAPLNPADPADCKVNVTEVWGWSEITIEFNQPVFTWNPTKSWFETKKCTSQTLVIEPRDPWLGIGGKTVCSNSDGSSDCKLELDVKDFKELTVEINGP